jgi:hypothetical protein
MFPPIRMFAERQNNINNKVGRLGAPIGVERRQKKVLGKWTRGSIDNVRGRQGCLISVGSCATIFDQGLFCFGRLVGDSLG